MELSEFVNPVIELDIKGIKFKAKRATLRDIALIQNAKDSTEQTLEAIAACINKVEQVVTVDQLNELFCPADTPIIADYLVKLGFMNPAQKEVLESNDSKK